LATAGGYDPFAESLFLLTLFVLAVLLNRMRYLMACSHFRVSSWAVSFPLAASAVAGLRFAAARPSLVAGSIALALLALATITIGGLTVRTLYRVVSGELKTLSA